MPSCDNQDTPCWLVSEKSVSVATHTQEMVFQFCICLLGSPGHGLTVDLRLPRNSSSSDLSLSDTKTTVMQYHVKLMNYLKAMQ